MSLPGSSLPVRPVLGLPLAVTDYAGAVRAVLAVAAQADAVCAVEAANTHVLALARHDPGFGAVLAQFNLLLPDGMPLVWCLNRQLPAAEKLRDRVYGPTLMLRCLEATRSGQVTHFLLGGAAATLADLEKSFAARYPGAVIAGVYSPPFTGWDAAEDARIFERIRVSGARLIWVGLGCPKQEQWISRNRDRLPPGVYFGIGAAFAFHAGHVRQAPAWMQNAGLEWLFRIVAEPRRLLRRYLVYNTLFVWYLLRDLASGAPGPFQL